MHTSEEGSNKPISMKKEQYIKSMISMAQNGFPGYISELLQKYGIWTQCRYWIIISALNRGDTTTALQHIRDWLPENFIPVSMFVPGDHQFIEK